MKNDSLTNNPDEAITCISCLTQNRKSEAFCQECGAPIGATANPDPLQTIQTEGFLFRKALEGRPKGIVLVGVWILHLPVLVCGVMIAVYLLRNMSGFSGFLFFWAIVGLSGFALVVLYRITRNYMTVREKEEDKKV